jgi:hypothetical protein
MARQITEDLQRFEGLVGEFERVELLAWRHEERPAPPVPMRRDFVDIALIWGRTAALPRRWALVQAFNDSRGGDLQWQRSLIWRELRRPLTHLRPGETADGTWHAHARYDHPPSSREICEFASVSFLDDSGRGGFETMSGGFSLSTWLSVAGDEPACHVRDGVPLVYDGPGPDRRFRR